MSSHKGSTVVQGSGAPASNRAADTVELAELGPLLEEKGKRVIATPSKVSCLPRSHSLVRVSPYTSVHLHLLRSQLPPRKVKPQHPGTSQSLS